MVSIYHLSTIFIFKFGFVLTVWYFKEFEDTKGVITIRKSKKNWQYNGQKKKRTKGKSTA